MRWTVEHAIDASIERVEAVIIDPATLASMPVFMKAIASAEALERHENGDVIERVTRFTSTASPPAFAGPVKREMMQWVERTTWNLRTHSARYVIEPNIPAEWQKYFRGDGTYRLEARGAGKTVRVIEGDLEIRVAIVGRIAERFAVGQLRARSLKAKRGCSRVSPADRSERVDATGSTRRR